MHIIKSDLPDVANPASYIKEINFLDAECALDAK